MTVDDAGLRRLLDRAEIHDVLMRYCRGVDRGDADLVRSAYHEGSWDDHGYWTGPGEEFGDFIVERLTGATLRTTHAVANELIELDGDSAHVETYVFAHLWRADGDGDGDGGGGGGESLDLFAGRYVDRFERRDGRWRIARRTVVHDWSCTPQVLPPALGLPLDAFVQGRRDHGDLALDPARHREPTHDHG
ncbi:nuclear transport factor 2 family protein [Pseudonocardia broussonetiae]|uniref:Nuclear transport factor 2 family protein n=1 Tax=Pseudonocardia broussonetiae TaxID=2736640 RepID=A0A6M6JU11_9PSEU|nr:nuclear transport factor 2 family protein [Pseudonocardia broussonetiae]QJY49661.1 nuclear transport factor 2 family protein [Pseudonocardia broussonetiae]